MGGLAEAIEGFRSERVGMYRDYPHQNQLERDIGTVAETVKDHVGRWPLELIQNCDDAKAEAVLLKVTDDAVYVADRGNGLRPGAIKSLSGTHLSDKPVGAIGRKGLGFKAVYEITRSPQVLTGEDEGVTYSPDRARAELSRSLGKEFTGRVPHEWLPFGVSRREAEGHDAVLAALHDWKTVVKLPLERPGALEKALAVVAALPAQILLTFARVRYLRIEAPGADRAITCAPVDGPIWQVTDSSLSGPTKWMVRKATKLVPEERLEGLEEHDRARMREVSLLVAAPTSAEGAVVPTEDYPKVCVYYPVGKDEEDGRAPVRLLLHADFLVSSDRTQVLRFGDYPLNDWIADRLAQEVVAFVEERYTSNDPPAYLRLLLPYSKVDEHRLARDLWRKILARAKEKLLLPDAMGQRHLKPAQTCFIASSVAQGAARRILRVDPRATSLLHHTIEACDDGCAVVKDLGATAIRDDDVVQAIADLASDHGADNGWLWTCWEWLGAWLSGLDKGHPDRAKRIGRIKSLPILPIPPRPASRDCLGHQTVVTWREEGRACLPPNWMPVRFVDDWFRDRLLGLDEEDPIRALLEELRIQAPTEKLLARSLGYAIAEYGRSPTGDPSRFLSFLMSRDWHESLQAPKAVRRCPVPVQHEGQPNVDSWAEASSAYFGKDWSNDRLAGLYRGVSSINWAICPSPDAGKYGEVLRWLGVARYPRVVAGADDPDALSQETTRLRGHIRRDSHVQRGQVGPARVLEYVDSQLQSAPEAALLLRLISRYWDEYYADAAKIQVACKGPRGGWRLPQTVPARWWHDLLTECTAPCREDCAEPAPLSRCWLPDPETMGAIGRFLTVIDLDAFQEDGPLIESWARQTVGVRTHLSQVTLEEWRDILGNKLPLLFAEMGSEDRQAQRTIQRVYEAALDSLEAQQVAFAALTSVPLLCRRANHCQFVPASEERWLVDNVEFADAFRDGLWQIGFPRRYHRAAEKHFGIKSLQNAVNVSEEFGLANAVGRSDLEEKIRQIAPFVYAWRRYSTKEDPEALAALLRGLHVCEVPDLRVCLALEEMGLSETVHRPFDCKDDVLVLPQGSAGVASLAGAIARALDLGPGPARFIQILLMSGDDAERESNLKGENIPEDQIRRYAEEFARGPGTEGPAGHSQQREASDAPRGDEKVGGSRDRGPGDRDPGRDGKQEDKDYQRDIGDERRCDGSRTPQPTDGGGIDRTGDLKEVADTPCIFRTTLPLPRLSHPPGTAGDGRTDSELGGQTSDDEKTGRLDSATKRRIEQRARDFAARELRGRGHDVQQMPFENEGFDLRAVRGDEVLLVEVKGHRGASVVADISEPQVKECERCSAPGATERWQLWNIEHLAVDDQHNVTTTVVDRIPWVALRANSYRLDLRQCEPVSP